MDSNKSQESLISNQFSDHMHWSHRRRLLHTMRVANSGPQSGNLVATVLAKPIATPACSQARSSAAQTQQTLATLVWAILHVLKDWALNKVVYWRIELRPSLQKIIICLSYTCRGIQLCKTFSVSIHNAWLKLHNWIKTCINSMMTYMIGKGDSPETDRIRSLLHLQRFTLQLRENGHTCVIMPCQTFRLVSKGVPPVMPPNQLPT